jgi:hypothetical protein
VLIVAIRKISSIEDDHLETCTPQVVVWMQLIVMKNFQVPLILIVPILMNYHELLLASYFTNTIMASLLTGVHTVCG